MSKIFLFLPLWLFAINPNYWWIDDIIYLPKDYPAIYKIRYEDKIYTLKFRWTLYKNDGIVMLYNYQGQPYQNILYKNHQLNGFKHFIRWNDKPYSPYFMIYFRDYIDGVAKFEFLIYNPEMDISLDINQNKYRDIKWVKKLKPLYQKQFEREIK